MMFFWIFDSKNPENIIMVSTKYPFSCNTGIWDIIVRMTPILFVFYFTPTEGEHKHRSGSYMSGGSHFSPWGEHLQQHRPRCGGPPRVQQQHQRTGPSQMHGVFQILIIQEDESPWEKRKYLAVCSRFKGTQPCNSNPQIIRFIFKTRHATKWQELWRRIVLIIIA